MIKKEFNLEKYTRPIEKAFTLAIRLIFMFFFFTQVSFGQTAVQVSFIPVINKSEIELNKELVLSDNQKITITNLRFYISKFQLLKNEKVQSTWNKEHHLIDLRQQSSLKWILDSVETDFDKIKFQLGLDSFTNVSGALTGDLDPTKGMYWTWQSGYINLKIEGFFINSNEGNKIFEYHLGGYLPPFQTIQHISMLSNSKKEMKIVLDFNSFFLSSKTEYKARVMSPGENAQALSRLLVNCFRFYEE